MILGKRRASTAQGILLDRLVCRTIADCNGGLYPRSFCEWRRVARRAGIRRIQFHDRSIVPSPILRYDRGLMSAVLYLPIPHNRRELYFWMLHEVGECLMSLEVQPVFVYPPQWGDHHDISVIVERHHVPEEAFYAAKIS